MLCNRFVRSCNLQIYQDDISFQMCYLNAGYVGLYLILLSKPQNYTSKGTKYVKQYSENENETNVKVIEEKREAEEKIRITDLKMLYCLALKMEEGS